MSNKYYTTKKENRRKTKRRRKKRGGWGHEDLVDFVKKGKEFIILYTIANPSNPAAADKHWVGGDEDFVFETHKEFTEALQVQAAEYKNPFKGKIEIIHIAAEGDYRDAAFAEFTANNISRTTPGHYSIDLVDVVGGGGAGAGFTELQEKSVGTGYRGLGLCSVMLQKLLSAFATIPQAHSVTIHLVSQTPKGACYCYTKAANRIGYTVGIDIGKAGELGFITKKTKKINTFFWTTFNDAGEWQSDDPSTKMIVNPEEPNPVVKGKVYNRLCVELPTRPRKVAKRNTTLVKLYLRYQADVYPLNLQRHRGGSTPGMRKRTRRRTRRKSRKKRGGVDPPEPKWWVKVCCDNDGRKWITKTYDKTTKGTNNSAIGGRATVKDLIKAILLNPNDAVKSWQALGASKNPDDYHFQRAGSAVWIEDDAKIFEMTPPNEQTFHEWNIVYHGDGDPDFVQPTAIIPGQDAGGRRRRRKTRKRRGAGRRRGHHLLIASLLAGAAVSKRGRRTRRRRKKRKKGGGNGSSVSSGSDASSSVAGPGTWIDRLSSIDSSTITPTEPSTERSSTKSSTESDWFFRGQQRPPSDLSGHGVGEDIRLLHGCEVATRSCPCHLPWKTGTCTYDKKRNLIYCKCRWKKEKEAEKIRRRTNLSKAARAFTSSS